MQPSPITQQQLHRPWGGRDLCRTCAHADRCSLREMPTTPVHDCSEYDDGTRPVSVSALRLHQEAATRRAPTATGVGLCVNCEHQPTCTLPRPTSGVWNCEEYR